MISDFAICASGDPNTNGLKAALALGDGGSPMFTTNPQTGQFVQTGVASVSPDQKGIARQIPSIFTRVSTEKKWIEENIKRMLQCSPGFGLQPDGLDCQPCPASKKQTRLGKFKCA